MRAFVTYLKRQSPVEQLASGTTGWLELPDGSRWNPAHVYKFTGHEGRVSFFNRVKPLAKFVKFREVRNGR